MSGRREAPNLVERSRLQGFALSGKGASMFKPQVLCAALIAATVTGCDKPVPPAPQARPVRAVAVERVAEGETVSLTGHVRAKDQASLAFRLDGRMIERPVNVGDVLKAGQLVARLEQFSRMRFARRKATSRRSRRCSEKRASPSGDSRNF